jgi:opacity protein-like surface antigen
MKKTVVVILLYSIVAPAAFAATGAGNVKRSVGINYGVYGVLGIEGEQSISSLDNNEPVSVQVFLKNRMQDTSPGVSWDTTGIGAAAIYDFNTVARLDKRIHPYGGIGLMFVNHDWSGTGPVPKYIGVDSGLYLTGGARYELNPKVSADLNFNLFGDLTVGAIFSF